MYSIFGQRQLEHGQFKQAVTIFQSRIPTKNLCKQSLSWLFFTFLISPYSWDGWLTTMFGIACNHQRVNDPTTFVEASEPGSIRIHYPRTTSLGVRCHPNHPQNVVVRLMTCVSSSYVHGLGLATRSICSSKFLRMLKHCWYPWGVTGNSRRRS